MADRRSDELFLGHPGRLSYLPYEQYQIEDFGWQSTRGLNFQLPTLQPLASWETWLPPTTVKAVKPKVTNAWSTGQKQKRWLLRNHPEAALGNGLLTQLLTDTNSDSPPRELELPQFPLCSFGELTDKQKPSRVSSAPVIATACGENREVLRLVKLAHHTQNRGGVTLHLATVENGEEVLYDTDRGAINQVKFVVDPKKYEPTRWLLVQRDTITTVFQPEYRKEPRVVETNFHSKASGKLSCVAPNRLFSIDAHETGGSHHSDVSYNPGRSSNRGELALIDMGGNWSIWGHAESKSRRSSPWQPTLLKRGHISQGILDDWVRSDKYKMQWHRILWVGGSETHRDDFEGGDLMGIHQPPVKDYGFPALSRRSILLLCNRRTIKFLNTESNDFLPDVSLLSEDHKDQILDAHCLAGNPRFVFVLTSSRIFLIDVSAGSRGHGLEGRLSVLLSAIHAREPFDHTLKLTLAPYNSSFGDAFVSVLLQSARNTLVDLFYFYLPVSTNGPAFCNHGMLSLTNMPGESISASLHTLCIIPVPYNRSEHSDSRRPDHDSLDPRTRIHQLLTLDENLGLRCSLWATFPKQNLRLLPSLTHESPTQKPPKRRLRRFFDDRFVISYSLDALDMARRNRIVREDMTHRRPLKHKFRSLERKATSMINSLVSGWRESIREQAIRYSDNYNLDQFGLVQQTLGNAISRGLLSAQTLFQLTSYLTFTDIEQISAHFFSYIAGLRNGYDNALWVMNSGRPELQLENHLESSPIEFLELVANSYNPSSSRNTLAATFRDEQDAVMQHVALDLYLSSVAVLVNDYVPQYLHSLEPPLPALPLEPQTPRSPVEDHITTPDPANVAPSSFPTPSLTQSARSGSLSRDFPNVEELQEDIASEILRMFTGPSDSVPHKSEKVLSQWPKELGSDPSVYDWSHILNSTETTEVQVKRQRQEAREARKRRRAETWRQMQQASSQAGPSTQPIQQMPHSDQPAVESSQVGPSVMIPMSQPAVGAFGKRRSLDLRPKKKLKRATGF